MRAIRRRHLPATIAAFLLALGAATASAQSPQGRTGTLVVLNKGASTATFIDVASGETIVTLPTGEGPHELAMTADGRWAVSTDYGGGNSLTVFDVRGPEVVRTIDLSAYPRPHGAFFLPGDSLLAVTSESTGQVVLVRPFAAQADPIAGVISTSARGSHMVAVTGDGTTLYTGDMGSGTVSRLDVATGRRTASYPVPAEPEAITVSRDGTQVWVGSNAEGLVSVLDPATGAVETAQEGLGWPYRILIIEARDLVVIPDLRGNQIRFVEYTSRDEISRLDLPGLGPQGIAITPDNGTLFLSLSAAGEVAVIDLESREIVRRIPAGPTPDGIGWSPITHPAIVDRPISFSDERKAMTLAYIREHYGLTPPDITITPRMVVLHWTAIESLEASFRAFDREQLAGRPDIAGAGAVNVSIHFLVDRDGTIYRLMPETWMARHVIGLNYDAIGVENVGTGTRESDTLTDAQVAANIRLVRYLAGKYPTIEYLIGHHEYTAFEGHALWRELDPTYRTSKIDPGPRFMRAVRAGVNDLDLKGTP